jgi:hypothetical protein
LTGNQPSNLPTRHIERLLAHFPPHLVEVILELRDLVFTVAPDAAEDIHPKGFTYYHPLRGGPVSAGICQIRLQRDQIRLAFVHGAFLPDPAHLLQGEAKAMRFVELKSFESAPWVELKALIEASSRFDPYTLSFSRMDHPPDLGS